MLKLLKCHNLKWTLKEYFNNKLFLHTESGISSTPTLPHHRLQYRRRSDFGSSTLSCVNPRQFSNIFDNDHHHQSIYRSSSNEINGRVSMINRHLDGTSSAPLPTTTSFSYRSQSTGRPLTQFKLNSLTNTIVRKLF